MVLELIFSAIPEIRNEEVVLTVKIEEKGSSRIVYLSDIKEFAKKERELALLLIKQKCKEARISPTAAQADTLSCQKIYVEASEALLVMQKLIACKQFFWKGRSLFFNPFSQVKVRLQAENIASNALLVSGILEIDGEKIPPSSIDFLFQASPVWGIFGQRLFVLPKEIRFSYLGSLCLGGKLLEGKEKERFIEDYKEDPPIGFPPVTWIGDFGPVLQEPYPILQLQDAHGAFADLKMDYEGRVIDFFDTKKFSGRNLASEKGWEKDLLETGFIRKDCAGSKYYAPLDKVAKSLSFLLEIGWKILDQKGRFLVRLTQSTFSLSEVSQGLILKGAFHYENHKVNLSDVVGAFTRRERFLDLGTSSVALLEGSEYDDLQDLTSLQVVGDGCFLKRRQLGLLEAFEKQGKITPCLQKVGIQASLKDDCFQGKLHPYQEEGRRFLVFLANNGFSGLLADEMGLGKTIQTLSFISAASFEKPILIVVPTSLLFNWKKEWETFLPYKKLHIHAGSQRQGVDALKQKEAILTSYAYLRIDQTLLSCLSFSLVVLDEAQFIKNPDSQLARAAFSLSAQMRLALSGTPIENKIEDLWSLFHFLDPELLGGKKEFLASLEASSLDDRHRQKIRKMIKPFILRRLKEEVAKDLPEKVEQTVFIEMEEAQRKFYEEWLRKTRQGLLKKVEQEGKASRMEVLEAILRLRQICCHPALVDAEECMQSGKLDRVLEDLEEVVSQKRKVLVYSQFTKMLKLLQRPIQERGWRYVYLDGETKDREAAVSTFQNDPEVSIFLISLKAGGVGLNLTAADYVFLFDPWWNEAVERQAIDRAHRFGRKQTVFARRYVMTQSIEEKILKLKEHKMALARGMLDFQDAGEDLPLADLMDLLQK